MMASAHWFWFRRGARRAAGLVLGLSVASCSGSAPSPSDPPAPAPSATVAAPPSDLDGALAEAAAGVEDETLAALLRDHWGFVLREDPVHATQLGVHAYDDRLADISEEAIGRRGQARRRFVARAEALEGLGPEDSITRDLFLEELRGDIAAEVCEFHLWTVSPRSNPVTSWNYLPEIHKLTDVASGDALVARYRAIAGVIDDTTAHLQAGASRGLFANAESTKRVITMVDEQLDKPLAEWPLVTVAVPKDWPAPDRDRLRAALRDAVERAVKPALVRYADVLKTVILPRARGPEASGLSALPMGKACYAARIRHFTTVELDAAAIHAIGEEQIAKTDRELAVLGKKALGAASLVDTLGRLRSDDALYFDSAEEVEGAAKATLQAAKATMSDFFGRLPRADCVVRRVPDYEAPYTTIAYYRPPHADGSKPGEYFVNVLEPETRPRYQARVLAVHEAIPGHHLQIAISKELPAVPAFRKHGGFTAFVEGWALYTERLGEEMGLYETDLDRIGVASFDAWRGGRLVVDTGIHAMGWSRDRAKQYLREHTALAETNIDNEVDRYINWPGQALAYKLGQLKIRSLRERAEQRRGAAFRLPEFHDLVLSAGAVTLPVLDRRVETWLGDGSPGP